MPSVSVLIPSYNHLRFLPACLESVWGQTFSDYEIVVVDDGSADGSVEYLRACGDRIRLFEQENQGTYATLNRCAREAKGAYLAILNSDDLWMPNKLAAQVAILDSKPEVGLVHTGGIFVDSEGRETKENPFGFAWPSTESGRVLEAMILHNHVVASSVLLRRDAFEREGGFDERLYGSGDWDMWLRVSKRWEFAYVAERLTGYRIHEEMASAKKQPVVLDEILIRTERIHACEDELLRLAVDQTRMMRALAHSWACLGTEYAQLGRTADARRAYFESVKRNPLRLKSWVRMVIGL